MNITQEQTAQIVAKEKTPHCTEIRVRGKAVAVPSVQVEGKTIVAKGKWLKTAAVQDEDCLEGDVVDNPEMFVAALKRSSLKADLFTFEQKPTTKKPHYDYYMEWDNAAIIPIKDYATWWDNLPQETRRNVRKSAKQGIEVKVAQFGDELVKGIVEIYNETPIRQGRRFWHYGKSFEEIKKEKATYLERSEFIGAYYQGALIGFLKLVYVDNCAKVFHILSKEEHAEKRPTNALIAKAVEICAQKGVSSFQYCKYVYGGNESSSLTEFKRRNGFEKVCYPRYYVPISARGSFVLKLKLHHGLIDLLPEKLLSKLRALRKGAVEVMSRKPVIATKAD